MPRTLVAMLASFVLIAAPNLGRAEDVPAAEFVADPPALTLTGPNARHSLLVHGKRADGTLFDVTRSAKYRMRDAKVAAVSDSGVVRGLADGQTAVEALVNGTTISVPVRVVDSSKPRSFHFENDILPLLGRFGCNSSGCHGKAEGQNGFKLSVFGFDPAADYTALLKEGRGRRVFPAAPERSLILIKAAGQVPHGGGLRIPANSDAFETIRGWVAAGAPFGDPDAPRVESIRIEPNERILSMHGMQQLRVIGRYPNGREVDVTAQARFQTNNEAASSVGADGLVRSADVPGEATVMASYLNEVAGFRLIVPRGGKVDFPKMPANNFIDPFVDAKLKKLNVVPSGPADDYTFVRRAYIDVIGTLPTPDEVRDFVKDKRADKRTKLVDALLERPEYADYWSVYWSDVLRVDRSILGHKRAYSYYSWIRDSFVQNKPYDKFARELITAEGLLEETPAANFYRVHAKPGEAASAFSQVFLGLRIACAECHHHPYDRWGQDDYYRMSAFFAPLVFSKAGGIDSIAAINDSRANNPRSGKSLVAAPLGMRHDQASPAALLVGAKLLGPDGKGDQRKILAEWTVSPKNPWFASNLVNRYWAHFLGRGLVDPVDDMRATNPATNPELLDALAKHFDESNYDIKKLIRAIVASRVYQATSKPNDTNAKDEQNYSRFLLKRLSAEVMLDAVSQTLGVPEKFDGMPLGTRAIQLWDSKTRNYFLTIFGRPARTSSCECERNAEANIASVLHLLNSDRISAKLQHEGGTVARFARMFNDDEKLTDEMFLHFVCRPATADEKTKVVGHIRSVGAGKHKQAVEDIAWALINSKEFIFNH